MVQLFHNTSTTKQIIFKRVSVYFRVMVIARKFTTPGKRVHFAMSNITDCKQELIDLGFQIDTVSNGPIVTARDTNERRYIMKDEFTCVVIKYWFIVIYYLKIFLKAKTINKNFIYCALF